MKSLLCIPISFFVVFLLIGCGPKIYSFTANTQTIGERDSVQLRWCVRGKPVMVNHVENVSGSSEGLLRRLEYTLVAERNGKEQTKFLQVDVRASQGSTNIVFNVKRSGDSLYAAGVKDVQRWGTLFKIDQVTNPSSRNLWILHENKIVVLGSGQSTNAFKGAAVSGEWEFRAALSEAEKRDSALLPFRLSVQASIVHQ